MFWTSCNWFLGWHSTKFYTARLLLEVQPLTLLYFSFDRRGIPGWGGGGGLTPHTKGVGMLVVSPRGVNFDFGFWSDLGCSGQTAIIFSREGLV